MGTIKGDGITLIMIFVGVTIAVVFLGSIADQAFLETNSITISNSTVTPSTTGNGTLDLTGREFLSGALVTNSTTGQVMSVQNFSINTTTGASGLLTVTLTTYDQGLTNPGNTSGSMNVSYVANPDGFLGGASSNIILLTIILAALAIVIFTIVMLLKNDTSFSRLVKEQLVRFKR